MYSKTVSPLTNATDAGNDIVPSSLIVTPITDGATATVLPTGDAILSAPEIGTYYYRYNVRDENGDWAQESKLITFTVQIPA